MPTKTNILQIQIDTPLAITPSLLNIPFLPYSGSLTSAPGYPYQINARFIHGSDYLRLDPDEQHVRLDVRATAQDKHTGALLLLVYHGVVDITGAEGLVIRGDENAHTTGFGNACKCDRLTIVLERNTMLRSGDCSRAGQVRDGR